MKAEVIALGTELTNGSKLDTNSQWLSSQLAARGVEVLRHSTVGDSMEAMIECLQSAARRVQFVVITGGLGPTLDDLTRQAMAEAAGVELVLHEPSLDVISQMFAARGREMPSRNQIQAMFPAGAKPVVNPRGTAPGIDQELSFEGNTCRLVALPGVPSEMKPMFLETIAPSLSGSGRVIRQARVNCFGAGESAIEEMLGELTARGREPEVGITASDATITLRIVASALSSDECEQQILEAKSIIQSTLGSLVFGSEDQTLADVVVGSLRELRQTVSVVEQLTAGRLGEWLHTADSGGTVVMGGVLAAGDSVPAKLGFAPRSSVVDMATRCRELFQTDYALAVGKLLSGTNVEVAVSSSSGVSVSEVTVVGNPAIRQSRIAKAALNKLRLRLLRT